MDLTLLGTGCPQVSTERYGPSNLVQYKGTSFLIDCGSGATQRLLAAGCPGRNLEAVFLTHLHSDHVVDLFQLIISSWHQGRDRPQKVFGPPGTQRFVDGLLAAWAPDLEQRIAFEKRSSILGLEVQVQEIETGDVWADGGLAIRAVEVAHGPVKYAFGFVFEADGQRLVFSGDTAYCPTLIDAAQGADVLVHECFIHRGMHLAPGRTPEGMRNVASYHTLSSEVGKVAAGARAKCLVLNHFVPVGFDRSLLLAEVRRDYGGSIVVGEDLMRIVLATGEIHYAGAVIGIGGWGRPLPQPLDQGVYAGDSISLQDKPIITEQSQ